MKKLLLIVAICMAGLISAKCVDNPTCGTLKSPKAESQRCGPNSACCKGQCCDIVQGKKTCPAKLANWVCVYEKPVLFGSKYIRPKDNKCTNCAEKMGTVKKKSCIPLTTTIDAQLKEAGL